MTTQYNANYIETIPFSDTSIQVSLTTNAEQTFTVPGTNTMQYQALFSFNEVDNVYVCLNSTPVVPTAGSVGTQQYNDYRPIKRYVRGTDVLHFITPDTASHFGVSLRQLQG